jgi:hypothetical protein
VFLACIDVGALVKEEDAVVAAVDVAGAFAHEPRSDSRTRGFAPRIAVRVVVPAVANESIGLAVLAEGSPRVFGERLSDRSERSPHGGFLLADEADVGDAWGYGASPLASLPTRGRRWPQVLGVGRLRDRGDGNGDEGDQPQ